MWRLANYIYRAFRNVTTHRCPQDILVPFTTICNKDEESNKEEEQKKTIEAKPDLDHIIKTNQFSSQNLEKVLEHIHKISLQKLVYKPYIIKPIEIQKIEQNVPEAQPLPPPPTPKEATIDSLLQTDETYMNTIKNLSELNEEMMGNIENEMAIQALESGNVQLGIETLQASAKSGKNAAALFNLGICYERGIGVAENRAKACDYYRQAAMLGHINAQFNLTLLSNRIDDNESEDEITEPTLSNKSFRMFRFSFAKDYKEEPLQSWNDYSLNLTKTLACLS
ncbi:hypothetical protein I4U23_014346 [Adineta vaga]|nr:hypothetical protein I4U23_014346 [Adineta vaga]